MDTREKIEYMDKVAPAFGLMTNIRQLPDGNWQGMSVCAEQSLSVSAYSPDFDAMMNELILKLAEEGIHS